MITVRFPTGLSIQYNDLDDADFKTTGIYLGKKSTPNSYSVWVPLTCIIEHISPCRVYNPVQAPSELVLMVEELSKEIRSLKRKMAKDRHPASQKGLVKASRRRGR